MNHYRKDLFPIHIYQTNIKQNSRIKEQLLEKINTCFHTKKLQIPSGWGTNKVYSTFDQDKLNEEIFGKESIVEPYYVECLKKFFDDEFRIMIHETWFNYYIDGEYQECHNHMSSNIFAAPSHFSCIHYLSFDPTIHEPVRFMDPNEKLRYCSLDFKSNKYSSVYTPSIKEGDFLMFPSYLEHYVTASKPSPDYPRITISCNIAVIDYGDVGMKILGEDNAN